MRSGSFITNRSLMIAILLTAFAGWSSAQSATIVPVVENAVSERFIESFGRSASTKIKLIDPEISSSAIRAIAPTKLINLTAVEARSVGAAIGCNGYFLIWSDVYRRSLYDRKEYYDAFAAVYAVSSRTGRLVDWQLIRVEDDNRQKAIDGLMKLAPAAADSMTERLLAEPVTAADILTAERLEVLPDDSSGGRMPIPYRRIRPESSELAFLYDVEATVEVIVDLSAEGNVRSAEVFRWAGFGLDDAAIRAIRTMNWRPAESGGRPTASRFIVRYNFKKLPKS